jgi:hypothetical protein
MTPTLRLGYDDFRLITRLCRTVAVRGLPPAFDFRGYLVRLLRPVSPPAASAVERMAPEEVGALRAEVAEHQDLAPRPAVNPGPSGTAAVPASRPA